MTDDLALLLIIWAIYLIELAVWIPRSGVLLPLVPGGRPRFAIGVCGNARGSLGLNHLFPFLQLRGVATQPPLALSPEALSNGLVQDWVARTGGPGGTETIPWEEVISISLDESTLRVNGKVLARFSTAGEARRHRELVESLREMAPAERETAIRAYHAARFPSRSSLAIRLSGVRQESARFRVSANGLFLFALVLGPLAYYAYPHPSVLLILLASSVVWGWCTTFFFLQAHRRLHPEESSLRFKAILKQLFCFPIAAAGAKDLSLIAVPDADPIAVAATVLKEDELRTFCRKVWLDLRYPLLPDQPGPVRFATDLQREHTERFLREIGLAPEELEQPEPPLESGTVCYCPRCFAAYLREREFCSECPGVRALPVTPYPT